VFSVCAGLLRLNDLIVFFFDRKQYGVTALMLASQSGYVEIARLLVGAGGDVHSSDEVKCPWRCFSTCRGVWSLIEMVVNLCLQAVR
jgi:hypothetical protein